MDIQEKYINAYNVDGATENMLGYIQRMVGQRVIYFHGWSGLGASALLRTIAEKLPSRRAIPELCFDRIIFIDCSEWKSRRSMQRAIAEELKLDRSAMAILDKEDEEDDFHGVDESSRGELLSVSIKINQILKDIRFGVVFYNGSNMEVDLNKFGIPAFDQFSYNILLWTFTRKLLTIKEHENDKEVQNLRFTRVLAYDRTKYLSGAQFYELLCKEATIIAPGIDPTMVADCYVYKLFLHASFRTTTNYDWTGQASNLLICDGILHEDMGMEKSNVLSRKISLECDAYLLDVELSKLKKHLKLPFLRVKDDDVYEQGSYRWISITSKDTKLHGMQTVPVQTSSFFLEFERHEPLLALPNGLFEHSSILGVLFLCSCAFNFASPPFVKCYNLKFLGLDHCSDNNACEVEDHAKWACLYRLRVLDLCSTYWNEILAQEKINLMTNIRELNIEGFTCWQYTTCLQGRLPNLEKLRIIKPTLEPEISADTSNSFLGKTKLEILDLSGNSDMKILPSSLSKASSLQVLVLDGCTKLQDFVPDVLPHLLRSFRLDAYGPVTQQTPTVEQPMEHLGPSSEPDVKRASNISKISLRGCTRLDNLFLRGLPNLVELDLSGSAIKVVDFETMVVEVPRLKRLFLLGCEHLRAIRWGKRGFSIQLPNLELLCIDTRAGTVHHWPSISQNKSFRLQVHAVLEDARLGWSLWYPIDARIESIRDVYFNIHVMSSSTVHNRPVQLKEIICEEKTGMHGGNGPVQPAASHYYIDVLSMLGDAAAEAFPEAPTTGLDRHIEIGQGSRGLETALDEYGGHLAHIIILHAESLHVHDVPISGSMPVGYWAHLKQCRMERCPKLGTVFPSQARPFDDLEIFWAFDLLMARQIFSKDSHIVDPGSFGNLQHLHLSSCPRLQYVLPVLVYSFPRLETLHIIHCGDLKHIFVLDREYPKEIATDGVAFPKLTAIHLHDLPTLRRISEMKMVAPMLETIKIRGCWSLRRLPVVEARGAGVKKPTVEIEKDVWDALEWDGAEASHHPSHFEAPVHSRYYKKKLPRTSVLR